MLTVKLSLVLLLSSLWSPFSTNREIYSHTRKNQSLTYFGTLHSHNPNDAQYNKLENLFTLFTQSPGEKIVLVEDSAKIYKNKKEAIETQGDLGCISFLARQQGIKSLSINLDEALLTENLLKKFTHAEVYAWSKQLLTRMWNRFALKNRPDYTVYVLEYLNKYFGRASQEHEKVIQKQIDAVDHYALALRQEHAFKIIKEYWEQDYCIFIVQGAAHARAHENRIKTELK